MSALLIWPAIGWLAWGWLLHMIVDEHRRENWEPEGFTIFYVAGAFVLYPLIGPLAWGVAAIHWAATAR